MTTHFSSGATNVSGNSDLAALRSMSPTVYYSQNFDFFSYAATDWVVTETDAGSTEAVVSGAGGQLAITNVSAGATDAAQIQWAGGSGGAVLTVFWDATKDLIMTARVKCSTASTMAWLVGAATVDTTVVASLPTDGLYFLKASGAATVIASTRKAGTSSSVTLGTTVADTFNVMTLVYTAVDGIWRASFDGTLIGTIAATTNSPTNGLCVSIGLLNAAATAHVLTVDYLNIMVQR